MNLLLLLLFAAPASAETMSLRDAVTRSLKATKELAAPRANLRRAEADLLTLQAGYDSALTASLSHQDTQSPTVLFFQASRTLTDSAALGVEKRFPTGTSAALETTAVRTNDNSPFTTISPRVDSSLDLSVSQPLLKDFVGRPERRALQAARERRAAARASLQRASEGVAASTAHLYWEVWRSSRAATIAAMAEVQASGFLETTQDLRRRGLRDEDDELQAEATWRGRRAQTRAARRAFADSADELLRRLTGKVAIDTPSPELLDPPTPPLPGARPLRQAVTERADIGAARAQVAAETASVQALEGAHLPQLDASAGLGLAGLRGSAGSAYSDITKLDFPRWSVALSLRLPFGGRAARADRERAAAVLANSKARLEDLSTTAALELRKARRRLSGAHEELADLGAARRAEERAFGLFGKKYTQGRVSSRDMLAAQDRLRRAWLEELRVETELAQAFVTMKLADGTLLSWLGASGG